MMKLWAENIIYKNYKVIERRGHSPCPSLTLTIRNHTCNDPTLSAQLTLQYSWLLH